MSEMRPRAASLVCTSDRDSESNMSTIYLIGLVVAAFLFVYLFVALLRPEWFS
jgi:K+-transporting ATPase KdpF subunit